VIAAGVWHIGMTIAGAAGWVTGPFTWVIDKPGPVSDTGPQVTQLERMQQLVSSRVRVSDILIGESTWLQGSWLVHGDALLSVDVRRAQIIGRDDTAKRAVIILPSPTVLSPRVDHSKTREWNVTSRCWYAPKLLFGNEDALRNVAMQKAQELIEKAAGDAEFIADAKQKAADFVRLLT